MPLLSVLQVGETLKGKLADDGKLEVRKKDQGVGEGSCGSIVRCLIYIDLF